MGVELTLLPQPCTLAAIASTLMQGYHILHLICHGEYSASSGQARLILADAHNCVQPESDAVIVQTLAQQLTDARMHEKDRLRLVFLATCESARRSSADAYRGLAPRLVDAGIPAVVAMQGQVGEQTARGFAATFYSQVLDHGQVDRAANEARNLIMAAGLPGPVIPVLFLRLKDGQLFATQQFAPLERVIFDGLIAEYTHRFAGRETELAKLEQFMAEPGGGYLVVQAGAGLGKTALIASLVARHHDAVAYHFFTPRIPESLQEATFLRSLLEQISPWYKQPVPPTRQPEELRKHYDALLGRAPDGSHTVILDGLDEVTGWDLARYLARSLPPGLHFILTIWLNAKSLAQAGWGIMICRRCLIRQPSRHWSPRRSCAQSGQVKRARRAGFFGVTHPNNDTSQRAEARLSDRPVGAGAPTPVARRLYERHPYPYLSLGRQRRRLSRRGQAE